MKRRTLKNGGREKAFWGALIPALVGLAGSIYGASESKRAQEEAMEAQKRANLEAAKRQQMENSANSINNYFNTVSQEPERELIYKNGGKRKLCYAGAKLTDGGPLVSSTGELIYPGQAVPPGTYRDLGPSHKQTNAQGKTGTGFRTSTGKPFETQGGETLVVDPKEIMVFSKDLKKNSISYADRAANGENPYTLTTEQYKQRRHLRHGKSTPVERKKALNGAIFNTSDYIGLGTNVLASLLSNVYASSVYDDLANNINYELPGYVDEAYVAGPTKVEDAAQKAAIRRMDINARNEVLRNTASANVGVGRNQEIGTNTMYELMKVADATRNKNIELRQANAEREQGVRTRNAANRNTWLQKVADIKNQQLANRLYLGQAKINSNVGMIQGIGSSIGGFLQQGIDNYQADQSMRALIASSPYGTAERMKKLGFKFSDEFENDLANDAYYRIGKYTGDTSTEGIKNYNDAIDSYNLFRGNRPFATRKISLGKIKPLSFSNFTLSDKIPTTKIFG